jgi:uncharacterized membrane protein
MGIIRQTPVGKEAVMDIGKCVSDSWNATAKYPIPLVLGWLGATILGAVSLGILAAPTMAGVMVMYLRARRGETPEFNQIFSFLNKTLPLLVATIVLVLLVGLGLVCLVIPGLVFIAWWMHVLLLMADGGLGLGEAMRESRRSVTAGGVGIHILFLAILCVLMAAGSALAGVGVLLTGPLTTGAIAMAYADRSKT